MIISPFPLTEYELGLYGKDRVIMISVLPVLHMENSTFRMVSKDNSAKFPQSQSLLEITNNLMPRYSPYHALQFSWLLTAALNFKFAFLKQKSTIWKCILKSTFKNDAFMSTYHHIYPYSTQHNVA